MYDADTRAVSAFAALNVVNFRKIFKTNMLVNLAISYMQEFNPPISCLSRKVALWWNNKNLVLSMQTKKPFKKRAFRCHKQVFLSLSGSSPH